MVETEGQRVISETGQRSHIRVGATFASQIENEVVDEQTTWGCACRPREGTVRAAHPSSSSSSSSCVEGEESEGSAARG